MLIASVNNKGSLYRLVMVKRCRKTVYFVNHFNAVGFVGSASFSTLCGAYKYFIQFNNKSKRCGNGKTKNSFNAGLF